jgi:glucosamine-6-phosphate deaminase
MILIPLEDINLVGISAANKIANAINEHEKKKSMRPFTLMLPTGSTPLSMYRHLIDLYNRKIVSFKNVLIFNLDEYIGLEEDSEQSYYYYFQENLIKHIDVHPNNVYLFNLFNKTETECELEIEKRENIINKYGGLDLIVAGIGQNGHLAFNEPFSSFNSRTRVVKLHNSTISANARFFNDINQVPVSAVTTGLVSFLNCESVIVLANGINKSEAIRNMIEGNITHTCPASILQGHCNVIVICDSLACYKLQTGTYLEALKNEEILEYE